MSAKVVQAQGYGKGNPVFFKFLMTNVFGNVLGIIGFMHTFSQTSLTFSQYTYTLKPAMQPSVTCDL